MDNTFFHFSFIIFFWVLISIRVYYHRLAVKYGGKIEFREKRFLRVAVAVPFVVLLVGFMVNPEFMSFARVDMSVWLQWIGFALGGASIPLTVWIHSALGINFSSVLHVREGHTLAIHGPYQWVRHPMYTVLLMHFLGILFLTENLLLGGIISLVFIAIVAKRINNEEKLMLETFGEDYRQYMSRTGRFLPKISY